MATSPTPAASTEGQNPDLQAQQEINDGSRAPVEDFGYPDPIEEGQFTDDEKKELKDALLGVCKHYAQVDKYVRRQEIMDARRQRFYRRGDQYIYWNTTQLMFLPWQGGGTGADPSDSQDTPRYTDVYNIYWPYLRALIAIGVQNPPGVNFEPNDPGKGVDITAARTAEKFRHFVDRVNKRKEIQAEVMSLFGTDGRTAIYTRSVRDEQKFGQDENGDPNTAEMFLVGGVLETKPVPLLASKQSDWIAFFWSDEMEINLAKEAYPQYAGKIKQGTSAVGESAYERMARIGVLQGTKLLQQAGDAYAHLATRHRVWLRPAAFRQAPDAVRDKLKELYPSGCKVVYCGDAYCGSSDQSMDDHITVGWPGPGDGAAKPSMLKDLVPVQDAFNDYKNLEKETADQHNPPLYRTQDLGDIEAIREQYSEPGNECVVPSPPAGMNLADCMFRPEPSMMSPEMIQAYESLQGTLSQFISGAQPALFGASDKNNDTASGISMLRDQAMGQFSIAWGHVQELFAQAYKQAVICATKSRPPEQKLNISLPSKRGKSMVATVAVEDLQKGDFHCYPDTDSSFPETSGSKRQTLMQLVTQALTNPLAADAYGVLEPDNLELQRELLGITDWTIPAANAYDKQMSEIEKLLREKPTPNMQAVATFEADAAVENEIREKTAGSGIPLPEPEPDPSQLYETTVKVDKDWDFHQFEYKAIKDWLSSPEGLEESKTNPWGVLNVKLHGQEHQQAMAALAPPPMLGAPAPGGLPAPPPKVPTPMSTPGVVQ